MKDKFKHIFWGAVAAFVIAVPVYASSCDLFAGLRACLAGVIAAGVKEWADSKYVESWSVKESAKDILFSCIGVLLIILIVLGMHFGKG